MEIKTIQLYDVVEGKKLPRLPFSIIPLDGDPIEIEGDLYFICERDIAGEQPQIGVIPLMVKNPAGVSNIEQYVRCLSIAHRKVRFVNEKGETDLENSSEMIVS